MKPGCVILKAARAGPLRVRRRAARRTIEQDVASAGEMLVEALFGSAEPLGGTGKAFVPVQLAVRGSSQVREVWLADVRSGAREHCFDNFVI